MILDLLHHPADLWTTLKETNEPIFLYGMGDGAEKVLDALARIGKTPEGVYASDEFVRGHSFKGYPVRRFSDVCASYSSFIALLCFAVDYEPMLSYLTNMSEEHNLFAPDVPVIRTDDTLFDTAFVKEHEAQFDAVYDRLADEQSKAVYRDIIAAKLTGRINWMRRCESSREEALALLHLHDNETYVDLGAYNGDTVEEFIRTVNGNYRAIYAFDPDKKNFQKLCARVEQNGFQNVHPFCIGAWNEADTLFFKGGKGGRNSMLSKTGTKQVSVDSVDHVVNGAPVTLLKLDVEGAETRALQGAAHTIRTHRPRIIAAAYHKNGDLFEIPETVLSICDEYDVYLRHHPYLPAWETNFYFVPKMS